MNKLTEHTHRPQLKAEKAETRGTPATAARTGERPQSPGFYQNMIFNTLQDLPIGRLEFEFNDGSVSAFGQPNALPHARIRVNDPAMFRRVVLFGDVGFGESYVDGDWDTDRIDQVIAIFIANMEHWPTLSGSTARAGLLNLFRAYNRVMHKVRDNSLTGSMKNIREHYDLSNDFFRLFLDPGMTYSSALFHQPGLSLEEAQTAKYDRLCRKLRLKTGESVLEIGSGWGGFCAHAAKNYGVKVRSITLSREQLAYARKRVQELGLSERVSIELTDYRDVKGTYDKIASIEMLEAVGDKHLESYFAKCHEVLSRNGLLGLQMITCPDSRYKSFRDGVDWIQKHIFPGSLLVSIGRVNQALNHTGDLFMHHLEDFGSSYVKTLGHWHEAFNKNVTEVKGLGFDDRFIRKWNYYLMYCKAAFETHNINVVQAVYTRANNMALVKES